MYTGSIVALITPFSEGSIDEKALAKLVRFHLENGTQGIVPAGTTGEAPTLDHHEYKRVIEIVTHEVGGQIPVIAGAGSYNTANAIELTAIAASAGADATLHVAGYYNRPNQEGLYRHFEALEAATTLPIIVYNIPSRAIVDIQPETMARIASLDRIIGVKDSTGDLARPLYERLLLNKQFCFLTGEDQTAVAYNAHGGSGCISVTANIAPALCAEMQKACAENQFQTAFEIQLRLMSLHRALFAEPSPAGVKYAASLLDLCKGACRLPIVELTESSKTAIQEAMETLDLI